MINNDITVSIICLAYNHEKYIRQTLEGFVSQQTSFNYEVIVHDDASNDNTASIIREYQNKYPHIIKAIFQTENQYRKKIGITKAFIIPMIKGKYIAWCEGDDYWYDASKLQLQFEALEKNPNCNMCLHRVVEITESGQNTGVKYPNNNIKSGVIHSRNFLELCNGYSFHTSSYFVRANLHIDYTSNEPEFRKKCDVGDEPMLWYYGQLGDVFFIDKEMSYYRRGVPTSWSTQQAGQISKQIQHYEKMVSALKSFDIYTNRKYSDLCNNRISLMLSRMLVLSNNSKLFFKKNNIKYYKCLSFTRKVFIFLCAIFPKTAKKIYIKRLQILRRKNYDRSK